MSEGALLFVFPALVALYLWAGTLDRWRAKKNLAASACASWALVTTFATLVLARIA